MLAIKPSGALFTAAMNHTSTSDAIDKTGTLSTEMAAECLISSSTKMAAAPVITQVAAGRRITQKFLLAYDVLVDCNSYRK